MIHSRLFITIFHCTGFMLLASCVLWGQFSDDFSSGTLEQWQGDTDHFEITPSEELRLNAPEAGTSFIFTNAQIPDSAVWECSIRLEFNPSGSNKMTWILQSDSDQPASHSGYGITFGESGSDDAITFVRYDQGNPTEMGRMSDGAVANDPAQVDLRIERANANFLLLADYDLDGLHEDTLTISDATYSNGPGLFTGLQCNYTSTRTDLFYFDDYLISRKTPDLSPPEIVEVEIVSDSLATLSYNEVLDIDEANFQILDGGYSTSAQLQDPSTIALAISPSLPDRQDIDLKISGVRDSNGNTAADTTLSLRYIFTRSPAPFEIVLNELMIAPGDETPLPDEEYFELYNRSEDFLEIGNLFVLDDSRAAQLPERTMAPGEYLILCDPDHTLLFEEYGTVIGVDGLPSLVNGGDDIRLMTAGMEFIHGIRYTDNWYRDPNKDRGWSLELMDPAFPCSGRIAYQASRDPLGGSPGGENSWSQATIDDSLVIESAGTMSETEVVIQWNQWLPFSILEDAISISPAVPISQITRDLEDPSSLILTFAQPLADGELYQITFSEPFTDCLGVPLQEPRSITVGVPATPAPGDLLVSEILFNPATGENQYVEVYNPSDRVFDFQDIVIDFYKAGGVERSRPASTVQILPGQYIVFTSNKAQIAATYDAPYPNQILQTDLPGMDRSTGAVQLWHVFGAQATSLDSACYHEDWHSQFLREDRGVALERLRFDLNSCSPDNWKSAAKSERYGTPTGPNSQTIDPDSLIDAGFQLLSPTFSPDGDGFEDLAIIQYQRPAEQEEPAQLQLDVFHPNGVKVRSLYNNYPLGQKDQLTWDGTSQEGILGAEGFYILKARTFTPAGETSGWRATIYLVRSTDNN